MAQVAGSTKERPQADSPSPEPQQIDVVEESMARMRSRADELRPLHEEYMRVTHVLELIDRDSTEPEVEAPAAPEQSKPTATRSNGRARTGSSNGGERYQQFLKAVEDNPGSTVSQIGDILGLKQKNYLYRIKAKAIDNGDLSETDNSGLMRVEAPAPAPA